ncbi:uncharacterized protein LOC135386976 [Ornithodoros turicata]|uniref:uncharacterized protein LOC135386976 n=1 Tax=Ornithodoros turicata TaxID=34597 RepID=UPI003139FBDE
MVINVLWHGTFKVPRVISRFHSQRHNRLEVIAAMALRPVILLLLTVGSQYQQSIVSAGRRASRQTVSFQADMYVLGSHLGEPVLVGTSKTDRGLLNCQIATGRKEVNRALKAISATALRTVAAGDVVRIDLSLCANLNLHALADRLKLPRDSGAVYLDVLRSVIPSPRQVHPGDNAVYLQNTTFYDSLLDPCSPRSFLLSVPLGSYRSNLRYEEVKIIFGRTDVILSAGVSVRLHLPLNCSHIVNVMELPALTDLHRVSKHTTAISWMYRYLLIHAALAASMNLDAKRFNASKCSDYRNTHELQNSISAFSAGFKDLLCIVKYVSRVLGDSCLFDQWEWEWRWWKVWNESSCSRRGFLYCEITASGLSTLNLMRSYLQSLMLP